MATWVVLALTGVPLTRSVLLLQAGGVNELLSKALLYSLLNRIKVRGRQANGRCHAAHEHALLEGHAPTLWRCRH